MAAKAIGTSNCAKRLLIVAGMVGCFGLAFPDKIIQPAIASSAIRGAVEGFKEDVQKILPERPSRPEDQEKIKELERRIKEMEEKKEDNNTPPGATSSAESNIHRKKLVQVELSLNLPTKQIKSPLKTSAQKSEETTLSGDSLTLEPAIIEQAPRVIPAVNILDAVRGYDCSIVMNTVNRFEGNCLITLENDDQYSVGFRLEDRGQGRYLVAYQDLALVEYAAAFVVLGMDQTDELLEDYRERPALYSTSMIFDTRDKTQRELLKSLTETTLSLFQ